MPTAAQYGMATPAGTDLISQGDNAITQNAEATAVVLTRLEAGIFKPQPIPLDANLNTLGPGLYYCRTGERAGTILNKPDGVGNNPFDVLIRESREGSFKYVMQDFSGYSGSGAGYFRRNTSNATGSAFIPWRKLDNEVVPSSGIAGVANSLRVQEFRDAIGPVTTNGRGAVALRFDHGLSNFNASMRPLVEARNIPYSLALSSRNFNTGENAGVTAAMVNSWNSLCEVWNHGANSHQDESSIGGLMDQIVMGKIELQDMLPNKKIWGYAVPGTGGTGQGGFGGGATPEAFYNTLAGDLILTNHAVSSGSMSGTARRPLDGRVRQGMAHFTIEAQTVSRIKMEIDNAINERKGAQLMMHPSLLDTTGYLTQAQFIEVLDYIVAKRDAGELAVLSPYEMMVADARQTIIVKETAGRTVTVWDYLNQREQMIYGNTGVRNIYSLLEGATFTGGRVEIIREGNSVELTIYGITPSANISNGSVALRLPSGFRPPSYQLFPNAFYGTDSAVGNRALMSGGGAMQVYGWTSTSTVYARLSWKTLDPWPATLPGVAA